MDKLSAMSTSLQLCFIQGIGGPELIIILLVILLFFGAKRLPELAKGLGKSLKEFKNATQDVQNEFKDAMDAADPQKPVAPPQGTADKTASAESAKVVAPENSKQ
jgi:sec-independent protein translocase protein TatA